MEDLVWAAVLDVRGDGTAMYVCIWTWTWQDSSNKAQLMCNISCQLKYSQGSMWMQGGGVRVNNEKVAEETQTVTEGDLIEERLLLLATGKKNKLVLRIE